MWPLVPNQGPSERYLILFFGMRQRQPGLKQCRKSEKSEPRRIRLHQLTPPPPSFAMATKRFVAAKTISNAKKAAWSTQNTTSSHYKQGPHTHAQGSAPVGPGATTTALSRCGQGETGGNFRVETGKNFPIWGNMITRPVTARRERRECRENMCVW